MLLKNSGNIYFASDFHLGIPNVQKSKIRERHIIEWLDGISSDAVEINLLGDIFDFWFEYKTVVPKGYIRLLSKLAELSERGITINFFTGNHDMWVFGYLEQELGINVIRGVVRKEVEGKVLEFGHGDGLGPGDLGYKFIKRVFANPICQWAFERLHPNFGMWLGTYWSAKSRKSSEEEQYQGDEKEYLVQYCLGSLKQKHTDYFIFGHRHLLIDMNLQSGAKYINLGSWLDQYAYAVFDGKKLEVKKFRPTS